MVNNRHLMGNNRHLMGNNRHLMGNDRHLMGNKRHLMGNMCWFLGFCAGSPGQAGQEAEPVPGWMGRAGQAVGTYLPLLHSRFGCAVGGGTWV